MSFKKIEIQGFKSFADKTVIPFESGLTCVVGPNGSGKSNVVEAVRWVLGEQSAKNLRGQNMHDVIFHGTEKRRSQSYCEVTLCFDNADRTFNNDFEEVSLSRRISRGQGSNEYYINNKLCRLRDITDMLYNTGISREGYTVIGQGKVQEIINAKPEDRRVIFEDAAGVAQFKKQKYDAKRDLEKTAENISRINDIITEINNRLGPLEKQAAAARKFNELAAELKHHEVNYYIYQYENNKAIVEAITSRLNEAIFLHKKAESELNELIVKYEKRMGEISTFDEEIFYLNEELTYLKVSAETLAGESRVQLERIGKFSSEVTRLEQEVGRIGRELQLRTAKLAEHSESRGIKERALESLNIEFAAVTEQLDSLGSRMQSDESNIESSNKRMYGAMERLAEIKGNFAQLQAEKKIHEERLLDLNKTLLVKKNNLDAEYTEGSILETNIRKLKLEGQSLVERHRELVAEKNEKKQSLITFQEDVGKLSGRISSLETKKQMLINMKETFYGFAEGVKNLMQDAKANPELRRRVVGLVAELFKTPTGFEAAIETAMGNALQNIVTLDEEDAKHLINYLKVKNYNSITFLPLTSFKPRELAPEFRNALAEPGVEGLAADLISYDKRYDSIMKGLLGSTVVVNNMDTAVRIAKTYRYGFRMVTLDGDVVSTQGSLTGGARKHGDTGILMQEKAIEETSASLAKAKRQYDQLLSMRSTAESDITKAEEELAQVDEQINLKKSDVLVSEAKHAKLKENIEAHSAEVKEMADEVDLIKSTVKETEESLNSVDKLEEEIRQQKSLSGELAEKTRAEFDLSRKERERLSACAGDLRVKIAETKREIEQTDAEIYRLRDESDSLNNQLIENQALLDTNRNMLKTAEAGAGRARMTEADRGKIDEKEQRLASLTAEKRASQSELSALEAGRQELSRQVNYYNEIRFKEQSALEKTDSEIQYMQEHIWEEYELTYQNALQFKAEEFDHSSAQQNINRLKRAINQLGSINPHAIEDYEENFNRHAAFLKQLEDVTKTRDDLESLISRLTDEMEEKFNVAFQQVNLNFNQTFRDLFNGGKASLSLEKSKTGDPLDAGVEIMAQPPGKKTERLSLLSGGEQSLTAIAILFAILKLKAMPFCILDEIDTALDVSNARLLAEYLKKMSDKTQFIVVTHKSVTMELADYLFGVTQVEQGVSKIVSVKLSDAMEYVKEGKK